MLEYFEMEIDDQLHQTSPLDADIPGVFGSFWESGLLLIFFVGNCSGIKVYDIGIERIGGVLTSLWGILLVISVFLIFDFQIT